MCENRRQRDCVKVHEKEKETKRERERERERERKRERGRERGKVRVIMMKRERHIDITFIRRHSEDGEGQ